MVFYIWPSDDEQLAGQWLLAFYSGEDADWWVGMQQCAATLALAVSLSLASTSAAQALQVNTWPQDDPAGSLTFQGTPGNPVEDYFWYGFISMYGA